MDPLDFRSRSESSWVVANSGLLRGCVQKARLPFFCHLLPKVHAADVVASQPTHARGPSFTSPLPVNIGRPELPDTGWERIKELFNKDESLARPEEITNLIKFAFAGFFAGFVYGGVPAGIYSRQRYIQVSQAQLYTSRVEAVRSSHNACIRGLLRYGWRWGWRVSLIVTMFSSVSTGLTVYRDKHSLGNYVAAGAVTVGLFRVNLGLKGLVAGSVIGAVLGVPFGAVLIGLHHMSGETLHERRRRERRELYEAKVAEWEARLRLTDTLISKLDVAAKYEGVDKDVQKIQELLSAPGNMEVAETSSGSSS